MDELQYQDTPADPKKYLPKQVWLYEAKPANGRWQARQSLNGTLLKCQWFDTEEHAQEQCRRWEQKRK